MVNQGSEPSEIALPAAEPVPNARGTNAMGRPLLPSPRPPGSALSWGMCLPKAVSPLRRGPQSGHCLPGSGRDLKLGLGYVAGKKGQRIPFAECLPHRHGRRRRQGQLCPPDLRKRHGQPSLRPHVAIHWLAFPWPSRLASGLPVVKHTERSLLTSLALVLTSSLACPETPRGRQEFDVSLLFSLR